MGASQEAIPVAADASTADETDQVDRWMDFYLKRAKQYRILRQDSVETPLKLHPRVLMKYTNPVRGRDQHGAFFVWTLQGQPQAIGSIWSMTQRDDVNLRRIAHEFHSLSEKPLISERPPGMGAKARKNVAEWAPQSAGVTFQKTSLIQPADSPVKRKLQLRQLARMFQADLEAKDGSLHRLRLLNKPIFEYESEPNGVTEGAIFMLAFGTDPELMLLIENRKRSDDPNGKRSCHFALARFTLLPITATLDGKEVWNCQQRAPRDGNTPYDLVIGVSVLPAVWD